MRFRHGEGVSGACVGCGRSFVAGELRVPIRVEDHGESTQGNIHPHCLLEHAAEDVPAGEFKGRRKENE